jgi:hypothetical protein
MIPEDHTPITADGKPAGAADLGPKRPKRKGGPKDISPRTGAKNHKNAADEQTSRGEEIGQVQTEQHSPRDAEQVEQNEQRNVEAEGEPKLELVRGYLQHPLGALFPRVTDQELRAWATDIRKHGQRHDIVQHPDGSILDGSNTLRACVVAGVEPRITTWRGEPGEELAFVISQNALRRHLNESQRAMIASKLAALPSGQRQDGKFAGVPTQPQAAEMLHVSERSVRTARKVREEAPANLTRLVDAGRLSLNAVESLLPRLSTEDKQRIEGVSDDEAVAEVERLNKESATKKRTKGQSPDSQANKAGAATEPGVNDASANTADDNGDDHPAIGADAVSRAQNRTGFKANTHGRQAFVSAIAGLPPSDAGEACELMSSVEQEVRGNTE